MGRNTIGTIKRCRLQVTQFVTKTISKLSSCRPRRSWWRKQVHYYYYQILRLRGTPKAIARGVAIGVFFGCFPFFGLQTLLAVVGATLLRGNRLTAMAATWISNPLTYVPIYAFNFHVGQEILRVKDVDLSTIDWTSSDLFYLGWKFALTLGVGCFVVGTIAAVLSYCLTIPLVLRLRKSRHQNRPKLPRR